MKTTNSNPRTRSLLLPFLFLFSLLHSVNDIIRSVCGILKPGGKMIRPLYLRRIKFSPSKSLIKIIIVCHVVFLGLGYKFGRIYDFTPILWYVDARIQGIDTTDCMNMPIEVWSRIPQCVEE